MTESEARSIAAWQYEGEFSGYNAETDDDIEQTVRDFLNPAFAYHAVWHDDHGLAGFCCYGEDAQVPGGDYADDALDIGLGLRPDLVGRGLGVAFLRAVLEHARTTRAEVPYRATTAAFNFRSRRLFEGAGFVEQQVFSVPALVGEQSEVKFVVMVSSPRFTTHE